jgi:regulator of replication initiation timing
MQDSEFIDNFNFFKIQMKLENKNFSELDFKTQAIILAKISLVIKTQKDECFRKIEDLEFNCEKIQSQLKQNEKNLKFFIEENNLLKKEAEELKTQLIEKTEILEKERKEFSSIKQNLNENFKLLSESVETRKFDEFKKCKEEIQKKVNFY